MSGILVAQGQERFIKPLANYNEDQSCNKLEYITGQNTNGQKRAMDAVIYGLAAISNGNVIDAGSTKRVIIKNNHGARKNDVIQFTSGSSDGVSIQILSCPDADTMILAATSEFSVSVGDTFDIKRYVTPQYDPNGALVVVANPGPSQFVLDGTDVEVEEDTVAPANNKPFPSKMFIEIDGVMYPVRKDTSIPGNTVSVPVELTGASGPINITAGDLNVQLSDQGPNADVTRVGDGTNQWGINVSKEGLVHDQDALNELQDINVDTSDIADSVASIDTKMDTVITSLTQKQVSEFKFFDYTGVSNAGYTELIASTLEDTRGLTWFESSGQPMVVAIGGVGAEVDLFAVPPGGFNGEIPFFIPQGSRVSIKQLNADSLSSNIYLVANLLK